MLLSVNKVPKKLGTDTLNKVLDFAEKYLKLNPRMNIHIEFVRNKGILWKGQYEGMDQYGETHHIDISDGLEKEDMIKTMFHELVHVKQTEEGDLSIDGKSWKGKLYKTDHMEVDYEHLPWEVEAFKLEEKMWKEFK
tara:strand:+ start:131 stop:541 length:411 start_codon:yes stop_codon:yes gene_type:complete